MVKLLRSKLDCLGNGPITGLPELREHIAARFSGERLHLSADNILVTTSGMQGLELLGKALLDEGNVVAAHFPTYLGALDSWRPRAPEYRVIRLDRPDFDIASSIRGVQFAYTVPNFSNPTGRLVNLATRQRLVDAAEKVGTWLVEDDPYSTLLYDGEPMPHMIEVSPDRRSATSYDGPVVYMGTLSKQIAPGLRIGWVIAASALIKVLTAAKQGSDMCTSDLTQRIALEAMVTGLIDEIHPAMMSLYKERRDILCAALDEHASDWLTYEKPVGGMFVWATVRDQTTSADRLLKECLNAGVCVAPSSAFNPAGCNTGSLRLNFTFNAADQLNEGVRRIAKAFNAIARAAASRLVDQSK